MPYVTELMYTELTDGVNYSDITSDLHSRLPLQMPFDYNGDYKINSPYDWRVINSSPDFHAAVDLDVTADGVYPNIIPILPGTVTGLGANYGTVYVESTIGNMTINTIYMHMKDIDVNIGDEVTLSTPLGVMWYTGLSSTSKPYHLHLAMTITENESSRIVDPEVYLSYFD